MVKKTTNINKMNNHLSPQIIGHEKDHAILQRKCANRTFMVSRNHTERKLINDKLQIFLYVLHCDLGQDETDI